MNKVIIFLLTVVCFSKVYAANSQYTLAFRDDPSTSVVVGWSGDFGVLYYGTSDLGTDFASYPNSKVVDRSATRHGINRQFVRLTGLQPKTVYYFVVRDASGSVSARYKFKTLSDNPADPIAFISGGDTRDGFKALGIYIENCPSGNCLEQKRKGNRLVAKLRPDFVAFNGDFVMNQITSNTTNEWNEWLNDWQLTVAPDGRMFPMTFTQGNHEDNQDIYNIFDVPLEEYYALNINNGLLRLYMLNSEKNPCTETNQLNWLTNDLQNHTNTTNAPYWKFMQYHVSTFAMGNGYGLVPNQMNCWVPLFEQYGVKLCMESHSHVTKWTLPCKRNANGSDFVPDPTGIVYIGEGNWGAPHRTLDFTGNNRKPYIKDQEVFDNFFYIRVNTDQTFIECVRFENVENVVAHSSDDYGKTLPQGVSLWSPANGNFIVINNETQNVGNNSMSFSKVSPNPTKDLIKIEFPQNIIGTVEVYNALGKLQMKQPFNPSKSVDVSLKDLETGLLYVYIKTNDGKIQSHRVVKIE